jgi:hypothetical protein
LLFCLSIFRDLSGLQADLLICQSSKFLLLEDESSLSGAGVTILVLHVKMRKDTQRHDSNQTLVLISEGACITGWLHNPN